MIFCITYDLSNEGDYSNLIDKIKEYSDWWHQSGSVWFICSDKTAVDIREDLKSYVKQSDKLFIFSVLPCEWAGKGFTKEEYDWFRDKNK